MSANTEYDAIIIGSGMGGMTCAAFLTKMGGKRVLLLEKHFKAGGQTHEFKRKGGYEWDVGLHYVGHMGHGNDIRKIMDYVTGGRVDWMPLPDPYDVFLYPGFRFEVPFGEDRYRERLKSRFSGQKEAIERYFKDVHRAVKWTGAQIVGKAMPGWMAQLLTLVRGGGGEAVALTTTKAYLDEHFDDPLLKAVLASQWGDYGLSPDESAFAIHATVTQSYYEGAFYPVGGAGKIAEAACAVIEEGGGKILVSRDVRKILVENGRAVGVEAARHRGRNEEIEEFRAPIIVSSVGAVPTYLRLLEHVDLPFRSEVAAFRHGHSAVTAFLGLKESPETIGIHGSNHWLFTGLDHEDMRRRGKETLEGRPPFAFVSFGSAHDPKAKKHAAQIISFLDHEAFEPWLGTTWKHRPDEYEALKKRTLDGLIAFADQHIPGLAGLIDVTELGTPLSFEHFTNRPFGAFYGVPAVPERFGQPWLDAKTPVENLYLTGSDVGSLGILGATMGGVITAGKIGGALGFPKAMAQLG